MHDSLAGLNAPGKKKAEEPRRAGRGGGEVFLSPSLSSGSVPNQQGKRRREEEERSRRREEKEATGSITIWAETRPSSSPTPTSRPRLQHTSTY